MSEQNNSLGLGEISTIREILVGKQITEFQAKFEDAENRMDALQKWMDDRFKKIEEEMDTRLNFIKEQMESRLNIMVQSIDKQSDDLNLKLESSSSDNKALIGSMLKEMGEKLLAEEK